MKSPFPGMDPYLERHWGDVHTRLITYICDEIQIQLPSGLIAQAEESLTVNSMGEPRWIRPDVAVIREDPAKGYYASSGGAALAEPVLIEFETETSRWVEIIDLETGGEVVTVIEILSPANKTNESSRKAYVRRRRDFLDSLTNFVEIDLLRGGEWLLLVPRLDIPEKKRAEYHACIFRAARPEAVEVYPLPLREPLPDLPIPLRETDEDVILPLGKLLARCYEMGRYAQKIDYSKPLESPLTGGDEEWLRFQIKAA